MVAKTLFLVSRSELTWFCLFTKNFGKTEETYECVVGRHRGVGALAPHVQKSNSFELFAHCSHTLTEACFHPHLCRPYLTPIIIYRMEFDTTRRPCQWSPYTSSPALTHVIPCLYPCCPLCPYPSPHMAMLGLEKKCYTAVGMPLAAKQEDCLIYDLTFILISEPPSSSFTPGPQ